MNNQTAKTSIKSEVKPVQSQVSCSCGVNKTNFTSTCAPNPLYATRCKCYKCLQPCNNNCRCKNCCNPCGVKPCSEGKQKRQRRNHSLQDNLPSSKKFAEDRGEKVESGVWSTFESIVLHEIQQIVEENANLDPTNMYNDVRNYATSTFCTIPLPENALFRSKSSAQINGKILHIKKQKY